MDGTLKVDRLKAREQSTPKNNTNNTPPPTPEGIGAYFDLGKRIYYYPRKDSTWLGLPEESFSRILRSAGFHRNLLRADTLTYLEGELMRIQLENGVAYGGELAGFTPGLHEIAGQRVLITTGPRIIEPDNRPWPTLKRFFAELFGAYQPYFFAWLKVARQSLRNGYPWAPGQILVLAGPAGCGKNLCQSIITELLGGRAAKPFRYMTGNTQFNKDLMTSEHLVIQDESPHQDLKSRRAFGAAIKDFVVNDSQSYHAKGRDAITLTPFWRLSISLNEETENLQILPPLDDSLRDKLMLFRCGQTTLPFDGNDPKSRSQFRANLTNELPGFLFSLRKWRIPPKIRDQRFGVVATHDPDLVREIESLSPEFRLWTLIETSGLLPAGVAFWEGTAAEMERELRLRFKGEVDRLLAWPTACGTYLSRLCKNRSDNVRKVRGEGNNARYLVAADKLPPDAKKK